MFDIPPSLVLGCNNPIDINPLKDYVQEQTGFEPDFEQSGFSDGRIFENGFGSHHADGFFHHNDEENGYGGGYGNEDGDGLGWGNNFGPYNFVGDGYGYGRFYGYRDGNGKSNSDGNA